MTARKFDINKFRVASPCPVGWETMNGDKRMRSCDMCELNVYNISEMTEKEVRQLVMDSTERICARVYRRADGTVMTKDCPAGLRAYRKRAARYAGAALSIILGLFSIGFGQNKKAKEKTDPSVAADVMTGKGVIKGTVADSNGAIMPNWPIVLRTSRDAKKGIAGRTNEIGEFVFASLRSGTFVLDVPKYDGFARLVFTDIALGVDEEREIGLIVYPASKTVTVGIFVEDPLIDTTTIGGTKVVKPDTFRRLPW